MALNIVGAAARNFSSSLRATAKAKCGRSVLRRHLSVFCRTKSNPVTPQLAALAGVTAFLLVSGMVVPGFSVNLWLSARDVDGAIMPPGMINTFDLPAEAMKDMAAVKPRQVAYKAAPDAKGDQVLQPRIENGVKVFDIEASIIRWNILPEVAVEAYAYNRQVPGPRLQVTEGDRVRINFRNALPESTTVHWHGLILPNEMDGPAKVTQDPVPPCGSYTYEFDVGQSGAYFYHSHDIQTGSRRSVCTARF